MSPRHAPQPARRPLPLRAAALIVVLALGACGTAPRSTSGAQPPAGTTAPKPTTSLSVERQWLQSWFGGTPVVIDQRDDGPVNVEVPREFCFDKGRSVVKAPLAAVLDKLAESLRRNPAARLVLVAAPADAPAASPLSLQRATQLRTHLLSRGVPPSQVGNPTTTTTAAVQLRMELSAL